MNYLERTSVILSLLAVMVADTSLTTSFPAMNTFQKQFYHNLKIPADKRLDPLSATFSILRFISLVKLADIDNKSPSPPVRPPSQHLKTFT